MLEEIRKKEAKRHENIKCKSTYLFSFVFVSSLRGFLGRPLAHALLARTIEFDILSGMRKQPTGYDDINNSPPSSHHQRHGPPRVRF